MAYSIVEEMALMVKGMLPDSGVPALADRIRALEKDAALGAAVRAGFEGYDVAVLAELTRDLRGILDAWDLSIDEDDAVQDAATLLDIVANHFRSEK